MRVEAHRDDRRVAARPAPGAGRARAGPRPEDGVCALRGRDVQRILAAEFGVAQTLSATYTLMHKLGLEPLLPLPPYSPELNCVERIWLWMRSHDLSNRAYRDRAPVEEAVAKSCSRLDAERIRSICRTDWIERMKLDGTRMRIASAA